jgi:hypothetical protein
VRRAADLRCFPDGPQPEGLRDSGWEINHATGIRNLAGYGMGSIVR